MTTLPALLRGICNDFISEPFHRFRELEKQKFREALAVLLGKPLRAEPVG